MRSLDMNIDHEQAVKNGKLLSACGSFPWEKL